jgi:hypothetical protein
MPRKRGFASWRPQAKSLALVALIEGVLDEYSTHLPLTVRQIMYRLMDAHQFPKDGYRKLCGKINRARRARMVPFSSIRDDGIVLRRPFYYDDADDFLASLRLRAQNFNLDRTAGQPQRLIITCESRGMVPQLERVAEPYGIPVFSSGGYDSLTSQHSFANELVDQSRPTEVLHIGDHDWWGHKIHNALAENVIKFAAELGNDNKVTFSRLAVSPAQIARYHLPTMPPNPKRPSFGRTCQAEALAPDTLATILRTAITDRLDARAYKRALAAERKAQRTALARLDGR